MNRETRITPSFPTLEIILLRLEIPPKNNEPPSLITRVFGESGGCKEEKKNRDLFIIQKKICKVVEPSSISARQ
jgi:hypothetical protein